MLPEAVMDPQIAYQPVVGAVQQAPFSEASSARLLTCSRHWVTKLR